MNEENYIKLKNYLQSFLDNSINNIIQHTCYIKVKNLLFGTKYLWITNTLTSGSKFLNIWKPTKELIFVLFIQFFLVLGM